MSYFRANYAWLGFLCVSVAVGQLALTVLGDQPEPERVPAGLLAGRDESYYKRRRGNKDIQALLFSEGRV